MKEDFVAILRKAEYWKRNLKPTDSSACAEKTLYDCSLQMVRKMVSITMLILILTYKATIYL